MIIKLIFILEFFDLEYLINDFRLLPLPEIKTAVFFFLPINFINEFYFFFTFRDIPNYIRVKFFREMLLH